jgi:hypothetical protein
MNTRLILISFCFLSLLTSIPVQSQTRGGNYNYQDHRSRNYYFGIALAYNRSDYKIYRGKDFVNNPDIAGVVPARGPGFNLQIISNLKIGENFDIRFLPGFSFAERNIEFDSVRRKPKLLPNKIESVFVELPFHVRYKSAPYHDKRLFVMAGIKYSYDIQSKSRIRQVTSNAVRISPTDFQGELGVGMQMFFPFFIFSPELKFSHGLGNILIYRDGHQPTSVLEKLMSRTFTISLHFEG